LVPMQALDPLHLELGSLNDVCELVTLD